MQAKRIYHIFAHMKKSTIIIISVVMGLSFLALLFLQLSYIEEMAKMKKEQFDESVKRSLYEAARNLELSETLRYLENDVKDTERRAFSHDSIYTSSNIGGGTISHSHQYAVSAKDGTIYSSYQLKTITTIPVVNSKELGMGGDNSSIGEASKSFQEVVRNRYIYQKALLDEVVYTILYKASDRPLKERINFRALDQDIRAELINNGIQIPYHFRVSTADGREVYRCSDFYDEG